MVTKVKDRALTASKTRKSRIRGLKKRLANLRDLGTAIKLTIIEAHFASETPKKDVWF
jgi:hypothetical protein